MKITILCDDVSGQGPYLAEQGLCILAEVNGRLFLWDSGRSAASTYNASRLGVDLREIDGIGISHGHFDHCGGLGEILSVSGPKPIFIHPEALAPKYLITEKGRRFTGIPYRTEWLRGESESLEMSVGEVEVIPDVYMTGEIPRVTRFEETDPSHFCVKDEELINDPFADDQALIIKTPNGAIVVTGCAHAGLVNTLIHITTRYGPVKALVGGTHLYNADTSSEKVEKTIEYLKGLKPDTIVFSHCTGIPIMSEFASHFKDSFIPGHVGFTCEL